MTEFIDDVGTRIAVTAVTEIFKKTCQGLSATETWLRGKEKERDFLGIAARRYATHLKERHSLVRVLGMDRPVNLKDIYVNVNILNKITERQRVSLSALEQFFDRDERAFGLRQETKSGQEVAGSLDKFIVLGKPGAGKTTFLKHLIFETLNGSTRQHRIPVFISLKDFSETTTDLFKFIVSQFDICHFSDAAPFLTRALERGHCQLLLNGLDEVDSGMQDVTIREIVRLSEKYGKNQFVISCRVAAYNHWFEAYTDVEMADFGHRQIKQFVNNWFSKEPRLADQCWSEISRDPAIRELATVPLLLTLLCLSFEATLDFPKNRSELYKEALDALLKKWDSSRRIKRSSIYKNLSLKRKESMFARIAAKTFQDGKYFIPQRNLEKQIADFVRNLPEANEQSLEPDCEGILRAVEAHHAILVQRAKGIYSFSHLTFQEYYTAHYIVEHAAEGTLDGLVESMLEERWREVFLLTSGMLDNVDGLFTKMQDRITRLVKSLKLGPFFEQLKAVEEQGRRSYEGVFPRCLAVLNLILGPRKRRPGIPLGLELDGADRAVFLEQASSLLKRVEQEVALDVNPTGVSGVGRGQVAELRRALKRARQNPNALHFGDPIDAEVPKDGLLQYMKAYNLLFDCLATECYVTRSLRKQIALGVFEFPVKRGTAKRTRKKKRRVIDQ